MPESWNAPVSKVGTAAGAAAKSLKNGGSDGTRTRGLRRDRPSNSFAISTRVPIFDPQTQAGNRDQVGTSGKSRAGPEIRSPAALERGRADRREVERLEHTPALTIRQADRLRRLFPLPPFAALAIAELAFRAEPPR